LTGALASLIRKARQLRSDPVLRRWAAARLLGREPGAPDFRAHHPPYLDGRLPLAAEPPVAKLEALVDTPPQAALSIDLAGTDVTLEPGGEAAIFERPFADEETLLALHRFAWLPLASDVEPGWVRRLWQAWMDRYSVPDDSLAWHPYTAAERCINILSYAEQVGLPGPQNETLAVLAAHGPAIAARLEYFGEHDTSNHLANNGRGLYLLGLALSMPACADLGAEILAREAARIFTKRAGVFAEESSHYHLLYTRNYLEAWLAAAKHGRAEAGEFKAIAQKALAAIHNINLPGGYPLIGDISPDVPPADLFALFGRAAEVGWLDRLGPAARSQVESLIHQAAPLSADYLAADGWLRADFGPWSGLWHAAPGGWAAMPGHGHQDLGGFELHYNDLPLLIDLGRGLYGASGRAAAYVAAAMNNGLSVDGLDAYPPNKPYYSTRFRSAVIGADPGYDIGEDHVTIHNPGFQRLPGCGLVRSVWQFNGDQFTLSDNVEGSGAWRRVIRHLATSLEVTESDGGLILSGGGRRFLLSSKSSMTRIPAIQWRAYNRGNAAALITLTTEAPPPLEIQLTLKIV
jgi:hypothetical protein